MKSTTPVTPEYLRVPQAAAIISMSTAFLRKCIRNGQGPTVVRLGKSPVIPVAELRRWMDARVERTA